MFLCSQKENNFPARPIRAAHADWLFNLTGDTIDIDGNDDGDVDTDFDRSLNESSDSRQGYAETEIPLEYLRKGASGSYDEENGYFYDTAWSAVITEGNAKQWTLFSKISVLGFVKVCELRFLTAHNKRLFESKLAQAA